MSNNSKQKLSSFFYVLPAGIVCVAVAAAVCAYQPLAAITPDTSAQAATASDDLTLIEVDESEADVTAASEAEAEALRSALSAAQADFDMSGTLKDGTYTGTSYGYKSYITVQVVISDGKISAVSIVSEDDDAAYMNRARALLSTIVAAGTPNVDVVSGATYSSNGIINAVKQALSKAGASYSTTDSSNQSEASTPETDQSILDSLQGPIDFGEGASGNTASNAQVSVDGPYADGTYVASAYCENLKNSSEWAPYYLTVKVEVLSGVPTITEVYGGATAADQDTPLDTYDEDNDAYIENAANGTRRSTGVIAQYSQNTAAFSAVTIDAVSGATYSSYAIREAYGRALYKAAQAYAQADSNAEGVTSDTFGNENLTNQEGTQALTFLGLIDSIRSHIKELGKASN